MNSTATRTPSAAPATNARFLNDAMMATLLGDVISDGLEDGRIVSGVGGQYNFIAQGFALEGARSAILLHATRTAGGKTQSNIRWRYGHTTIPRHLRDIIVTEYGIADIRGKSDREVIAAMLAITDARFQDELLRQAKDAGKIERAFELPKSARDNTPEAIERALKTGRRCGLVAVISLRHRFHRGRAAPYSGAGEVEIRVTRALAGLFLHGLGAAPRRMRIASIAFGWRIPKRVRPALRRTRARRVATIATKP